MSLNLKKALVSSMILSIAAVGCGDSKKGVDSDGNCDAGYLSAINAVANSAKEVMEYYNSDGSPTSSATNNPAAVRAALRKMDTKCDAFLSNYKGVSCNAVLESTHAEGMTNIAGLETACAAVKSVLSGGSSAKTTTPETETAGEPSSVMQNFMMDRLMPVPTDENVEVVPADLE